MAMELQYSHFKTINNMMLPISIIILNKISFELSHFSHFRLLIKIIASSLKKICSIYKTLRDLL